MNRRHFLAFSGFGFAETFKPENMLKIQLPLGRRPNPKASSFESHLYLRLVEQIEQTVENYVNRQEMTQNHPWFGGVANRYGIHSAFGPAGLLRHLSTAWTCPESNYHHDAQLLERMRIAAGCLMSVQHADGTIDLPTTNFHSPPDTGFVMENVCLALSLLRAENHPATAKLDEILLQFVERAAAAMAVGGIHTPNHRWVVCMALARAHSLKPDPTYIGRIDQWLQEKIDIDPDGQYTERSTSIYSPLTNRCLITIARLLNRPDLLEPVRRNLEMTAYYMHADGEVATEGSRRQDQYQRGSMSAYHYSYRYMALKDGNGRFTTIARSIVDTAVKRLTSDLGLWLEDPFIRTELPAGLPLPTNYKRHFAHSNLVRIRRGATSATILGENPTFFSFHKGSAAVVVRMAQAFFGKGQFVSADLQETSDGWLLQQDLQGPYYQPLPPKLLPEDGDWHKMDRNKRPQSEVQHQRSTVRIKEQDGGFELDIRMKGTDGVPFAIELGFRSGGELRGVTPIEGTTDTWLMTEKTGNFEYGNAAIKFTSKTGEHSWTQLRGALPKLQGDSVYITGFTPIDLKLKLT